MTIVRGTVPAQLFGRGHYGALLGRLARPSFVARSVAPMAFSLVLAAGMNERYGIAFLALLAALALIAYQRAVRMH